MKPPRILFIAPTRIGDAVLASAVLRHIATAHPEAKVTIATSVLAAPLYECYPLLERIIRIEKKSYSRHWFDLWRTTAGRRWAQVWDIKGSGFAYTVRAGRRRRFNSSQVLEPKVVQYTRQLATGPLPYPVLWLDDTHRAQAQAMMPDGPRYLILAPTANWAPKQWPMAHFITLGKTLLGQGGPCEGWRPVIISAGHEQSEAAKLVEGLQHFSPVDLTDGSLPLLSIYGCMQRAHGFVGNDSGLMHMAAAAGVPTLGLFGPTPAAIYGPYGLRTRAVVEPAGELAQLSPTRVASEFAELLHTK